MFSRSWKTRGRGQRQPSPSKQHSVPGMTRPCQEGQLDNAAARGHNGGIGGPRGATSSRVIDRLLDSSRGSSRAGRPPRGSFPRLARHRPPSGSTSGSSHDLRVRGASSGFSGVGRVRRASRGTSPSSRGASRGTRRLLRDTSLGTRCSAPVLSSTAANLARFLYELARAPVPTRRSAPRSLPLSKPPRTDVDVVRVLDIEHDNIRALPDTPADLVPRVIAAAHRKPDFALSVAATPLAVASSQRFSLTVSPSFHWSFPFEARKITQFDWPFLFCFPI